MFKISFAPHSMYVSQRQKSAFPNKTRGFRRKFKDQGELPGNFHAIGKQLPGERPRETAET
jgi:hypothetical protein